tara:strand:- start:229 stop:432 length:204 start_codon:yes stop_codon:yes gene_type:complete
VLCPLRPFQTNSDHFRILYQISALTDPKIIVLGFYGKNSFKMVKKLSLKFYAKKQLKTLLFGLLKIS